MFDIDLIITSIRKFSSLSNVQKIKIVNINHS